MSNYTQIFYTVYELFSPMTTKVMQYKTKKMLIQQKVVLLKRLNNKLMMQKIESKVLKYVEWIPILKQ